MDTRDVRDEELLGVDLFAGDKDDAGARLCSSRIVTIRKPRVCGFSLSSHAIPVGSRARVEKALIDDAWVSFYVCCDCLKAWILNEEVA